MDKILHDDRREHQRFYLRAFAELGTYQREWAAHVLDISMTGARIALLDDYHLALGDAVHLRVEIPEAKAPKGTKPYLVVHGTLVHLQEHILGISYKPDSDADAELLRLLIDSLGS